MAQHGYLGDGYGTHGEVDPDRDDDRRNRSEDRERRWRGERDEQWSGGDRGLMFGGRERDRFREPDAPRDRSMSDDDRRDLSRSGARHGGDWERAPRNFSASQDDHYRSWRDRQMAELDRDYQDYCREREQQFHREFDDWRQARGQRAQSGSQGASSEAELELTARADEPPSGPDPMSTATLGTSNADNATIGRGGRSGR
jgi:hypothetical protein